MAKKISIKIDLTMTGYDDQVDFIKQALAEDLNFGITHGDYVFDVEDVPEDQIDDFCHEMKDQED